MTQRCQINAVIRPRLSKPMPSDRPIQLAQFLKLVGAVQTGGEAKVRIQGGEVQVNGEIETRRGRKLKTGDLIQIGSAAYEVPIL